MKFQHFYFSLFLSLLFSISSCKKDNENEADIAFPRKLYVTQLTQKGAVKVYTANGEITDAGIIDKFLGQQRDYFNRTYVPGDTGSMTFISRDTMMLSSLTTKFVVSYNNGQFIFTDAQYIVPVDKTDILYKLLKYDYPLIAVPVAANVGAPFLGKDVCVAYGDYTTLRLSVLSYKFTSRTDYLYNMNSAIIYNEFNSTVISQLKPNDTLAIQESFLTLKHN